MRVELSARRVLLLQGPAGPFFRRFAADLEAWGVEVHKVNFNPGDALYYRRPGAVAFREPMNRWPAFLEALMAERGIEAVFLFGDCRPHHRQAVDLCHRLGVPVWVFEEGYLRPDYVTLERDGVNGHSQLPKDPDFYRRAAAGLPPAPVPLPVGPTFGRAAWQATVNAWAVTLLGWRYPHYRHHRDIHAVRQGYFWLRSLARKWRFRWRERGLTARMTGEWSGRYFFVPLQVHCDAQLHHSPFASMEEFIDAVVGAFARHAPPDTLLVLKHHPHDRAYRDYGRYLAALSGRLGCAERVVYVHDLHLPTLLKHARGTVTMNSTVGLSSLYHRTPVKVLGSAVYDLPGLTCQRPLAEFLVAPGEVDGDLYQCFCRYLIETNQINGSFNRRTRGVPTHSGLVLERAPVRSASEPQPTASAAAARR